MTSLSPPIQSVLDLFKGPLASVRFADIDAAGLANLAAEVEAAAAEVERQEAKLSELRQGLAQRQEALLVLAQQALAYARVYAENDESLLEELNLISLPRAAKTRKPGSTKAIAGRDAARSPPEPRAEPEAVVAAGAEALNGEAPVAATDAVEGTLDKAEAAPRAPRKARAATPQRASN
jgi:hypothetical protein